MNVATRCASCQSWINPSERVMSILNIGLHNCALSREKKGSTELEYKCPSMKSIKSKHQEIVEELETSIEPVRRTMKNRIRKLALKD